MFATSIAEDQLIDHDLGRWAAAGGVEVTLSIPRKEGAWPDASSLAKLGTWIVTFDDPRPSIFADVRVCTKIKKDGRCVATYVEAATQAYNKAVPSEVLSYPLAGSGGEVTTTNAFIRKQDWFVAALNQFKDDTGPTAVSPFCRNIKSAVTEIGLNALDATIVVKAIREGLPLPAGVVAEMKVNHDCLLDG